MLDKCKKCKAVYKSRHLGVRYCPGCLTEVLETLESENKTLLNMVKALNSELIALREKERLKGNA